MPVYDFRCPDHGDFELYQLMVHSTPNATCSTCGYYPCPKVLTFPAIKVGMPEHFNTSLGSYVSNERDYRDGLKEASEAASARAGREVSYSPVDMRDKGAVGVTDEGLDSTRRREVKEGKRDVTKHF